ncbi:MAG: DsbA family protein [Pseudomonadota bacterium]
MRKSLFLAASALALFLPACSDGVANAEPQDRAEIESIVREYILENPEIIEEALIKLSERQQAEEAAAQVAAISENQSALFDNEKDYSIGPDDAPVTVVEFFDYRCGFCKRSLDYVAALPEVHDNQVRVVFKELPILSPQSRVAALAALAAGRQGKYFEMHAALMESTSQYSDSDIDAIAEQVGVDVAKMRADMKSTDVQQELAASQTLANQLGVTATPTFIIGDDVVPGANTPQITALIRDALAEG